MGKDTPDAGRRHVDAMNLRIAVSAASIIHPLGFRCCRAAQRMHLMALQTETGLSHDKQVVAPKRQVGEEPPWQIIFNFVPIE